MGSLLSRPGFAPFQSRDFSLFIAYRFLTSLATQMINVGVAWLIYKITGSALALGLIGLCIFIPNITFILVAGHVADRYDRRLVLVCCYLLAAVASAGLFAGVYFDAASPALIFIMVALIGTSRAFASPASAAIVPNLVPREHFASAVALSSSANQTATIGGPALGGIIYAIGPNVLFSMTTVFFLIGVCLLVFVKRQTTARHEKLSWEYLTAGIRYIWSRPILSGLISLDLVAVLLGGATALLPIYAKDIFLTGPWGLGLLRSAPAAGAFLMALVLANFPLNAKVGLRMFQAVGLFGLATIFFGFTTNIYAALPFLFILGGADMVSVYIRSTIMQIETPDEMRGRVSAVSAMFVGASNELGEFESGALASVTGPVAAVVIGGVGTLGAAAGWMKLFPEIRHRDKLVQ